MFAFLHHLSSPNFLLSKFNFGSQFGEDSSDSKHKIKTQFRYFHSLKGSRADCTKLLPQMSLSVAMIPTKIKYTTKSFFIKLLSSHPHKWKLSNAALDKPEIKVTI